jgi:hypothetical protein
MLRYAFGRKLDLSGSRIVARIGIGTLKTTTTRRPLPSAGGRLA